MSRTTLHGHLVLCCAVPGAWHKESRISCKDKLHGARLLAADSIHLRRMSQADPKALRQNLWSRENWLAVGV
jgi:hypothetical protein